MGRGVGRLGAARTGLGAWCGSHAGEWLAARSSACQIERVVSAEVVSLDAGTEDDDGARDGSGRRWSPCPDHARSGVDGATEGLARWIQCRGGRKRGGGRRVAELHGRPWRRRSPVPVEGEKREMRQGERCEEGEKGADERRGGASAMATEGCP